MSSAPVSKLPKERQKEFFADLNYLNLAEIQSFCKQHSIPYRIAIETPAGRKIKTRDDDRKGVVLDRIRHFLRTGVVLEETCFRAGVVCFDPLPEPLTTDDRLHYGQYDKGHRELIALLKDLTDGQFEDGAIARIVAREFWSRGTAPTFREYASAWLQASREHTRPNPEWAFLSDRADRRAVPDWKKFRGKKAKEVLEVLRRITKG